jgi:DNA-binding transcriptional LysR family regulator
MTLDQIIVLETIITSGSFRNASLKLNRAQSAISYAIKKMESEFEVQIFDRSAYRPRLTPAGEAILKKGREILLQLKDLEDLGKSLKKGCEPTLKMAISALYPLDDLLPHLKQIKKDFPMVELVISIDILSSDKLLLENKVDLALTEIKGDDAQIENLDFDHVTMIAVAAKGVAKKNFINSKDLPQIVIRSSEPDSNRSSGVHNLTHHWKVTDFHTKKKLLLEGLGWGYMPEHWIADELKKEKLEMIIKKKMRIPIYLCNLRSKTLGPATSALKAMLSS